MKEYMFVFGRDPEISLAETISYFKGRNMHYILKFGKDIGIFSLDYLDFKKVVRELGGTVKIAEVLSNTKDLDEIEYNLNENLKYIEEDKMNYAISSYKTKLLSFVENYLKMRFKNESIKATYKKPSQKYSSIMMPSKLGNVMEKGFELIIYGDYIGKTIAVSDPREFEKRDVERPVKDYLKSTSIRLAKILINLSQTKEGILLDPFCGTGVILQESLLMNLDVIGIDKDRTSIEASKKNLDWIKTKFNLKNNYDLGNVESSKIKLDKKIDCIVTEPYLGPYIKKLPTREEGEKIIKELEILYYNVLLRCKEYLKNNGKIVMIIPKFRIYKSGFMGMNFMEIVNKLGLEVIGLEGANVPLLYRTKEGKFDREIYILNKK